MLFVTRKAEPDRRLEFVNEGPSERVRTALMLAAFLGAIVVLQWVMSKIGDARATQTESVGEEI